MKLTRYEGTTTSTASVNTHPEHITAISFCSFILIYLSILPPFTSVPLIWHIRWLQWVPIHRKVSYFPWNVWSLLQNIIFAKQQSLNPGGKHLCLPPPMLIFFAWEGNAVRLCISYWKRELAFFSIFPLLSLGRGMHDFVHCTKAFCRLWGKAGSSGRESGFNL